MIHSSKISMQPQRRESVVGERVWLYEGQFLDVERERERYHMMGCTCESDMALCTS